MTNSHWGWGIRGLPCRRSVYHHQPQIVYWWVPFSCCDTRLLQKGTPTDSILQQQQMTKIKLLIKILGFLTMYIMRTRCYVPLANKDEALQNPNPTAKIFQITISTIVLGNSVKYVWQNIFRSSPQTKHHFTISYLHFKTCLNFAAIFVLCTRRVILEDDVALCLFKTFLHVGLRAAFLASSVLDRLGGRSQNNCQWRIVLQ